MPSDQEEVFKQEILGGVTKQQPSDDFYVTEEIARTSLSSGHAVVRCFCLGCGYPVELSGAMAADLAQKAGAQIPVSWQGLYFKVRRCLLCDKEYKDVSLEQVTEL